MLVSLDAQLFKQMDGSFMEFTFEVQSIEDFDSDPVSIQLNLEYRLYDIRPKHYYFDKNIGMYIIITFVYTYLFFLVVLLFICVLTTASVISIVLSH